MNLFEDKMAFINNLQVFINNVFYSYIDASS